MSSRQDLQPRLDSSHLTISNVPRLCHPEIDQIQALAKERSAELGIVVPRFYDAHASMTPFLYSKAPVDRVVTTTLFNNILYYIDDVLGEDIIGAQASDSLAAMVIAVWRRGLRTAGLQASDQRASDQRASYRDSGQWESSELEPAIETLLTAVDAVRNEILAKSNEVFFERLTESLVAHVRHVFRPRLYRNLPEYLQTRAHFGGMYLVFKMAEFASNLYVDDSVMESIPSLRSAEGACVHLGGLSNDLFSYPKEKHSDFNLVNAYLKLRLVSSLEEAVQCALDLVNHFHAVYEESIAQTRATIRHLPQDSRRVPEAYVESLQNILSASYHWQRFTERYRDPEHFFDDLQ